MTSLSSEYHIRKLADTCAGSDQPLNPGDPIVAALIENEAGDGFDRLDYTVKAWDEGHRPERLFAFWRTTVAEPNKDNRPRIDAETIGDLFDQLAEATDPKQIALRYVLTLMMMRKRLLTFVEQRDSQSGRVMVLRRRGAQEGEPPVEVADPGLSENMFADLSEQITPLLGLDS